MRWISLLNLFNLFFLVTAGALACAALFYPVGVSEFQETVLTTAPKKNALPKNSFTQPEEAYASIGQGALSLHWETPNLELPDLREEISYQGRNTRPDVFPKKALFHICLKKSGEVKSIEGGQKIYLRYQNRPSSDLNEYSRRRDQSQEPIWNDPSHQFSKGAYVFSPHNMETSLWIEMTPLSSGFGSDETVEVCVNMFDEKNSLITSPKELNRFVLSAKENVKTSHTGWEIGGYRVDSTLLVRQKARWAGPDIFLEMHGGDDYAHAFQKERLDFTDAEPYCCFVEEGDFLTWSEGKWRIMDSMENGKDLPLLVVKKIEERVMIFDLWDGEGRSKTVMSLIRTKEQGELPDLRQHFKFVGAKTWAQFVVEYNTQRILMRPNDWFLLTDGQWIKLNTPNEIDDYANQRLVGPLFVLDKMVKQNGRQVLVGHLFNATRTEVQTIELPAMNSLSLESYGDSYSQDTLEKILPATPPTFQTVERFQNEESGSSDKKETLEQFSKGLIHGEHHEK